MANADRHAVSAATPGVAMRRAAQALIAQQHPEGRWEGEVIWCPMIAAQYVLAAHVIGLPIASSRRQALLRQFESSRLSDGTWGLYVETARSHGAPRSSLFVTGLVYVAARLLDVPPDDPLLTRGKAFIDRAGGLLDIPAWGKFWLAVVNLYPWHGVAPVLPELWLLPRWLFAHPGNFYCHLRRIYAPMAYVFASGHQGPLTPRILELRHELFARPWTENNFAAARYRSRPEDLWRPPTVRFRAVRRLSVLYECAAPSWLRRRAMARLLAYIRYDLRTTSHTAISAVSGIIDAIALWLNDPSDTDLARVWSQFDEMWTWMDDERGLRIAGARSATWDSAFALQALEFACHDDATRRSLQRGRRFLATQQIFEKLPQAEEFHRIDPQGGFCFAGVWHGWPVSDCTAEAICALGPALSAEALSHAAEFILRCQNPDGAFGTYEPRKTQSTLEWLNPAEMFSASMTEHSFVECTASCIAALRAARGRLDPDLRVRSEKAVQRAVGWLVGQQRRDGSWPGFWGVHFIYGTLFGIRGLASAGGHEKAVARGCEWLVARQNQDGGWGEHHDGCRSGTYTPHPESQAIQTAWALLALIEGGSSEHAALDAAALYLARTQSMDGTWPEQDHVGVFFRTALIQFPLYRTYFPLWALAAYVDRRGHV
ncbi:prenyltransferase/squalene oxidase repeat-containing protein [Sorangium atrum]|uniref:Prenyltransferase/squalene oxidase repeat-containing protein n=1 Tax=Sorangium atrum TaxID=2995308 RepID=A0ABT5CJ24_9BACT|nr:prenyltransferase/squalene oxidase repeat-containing protein [Sorangium aterium]MDC0685086.1 prenyltransferase/squalene oxidase repeat-containing protein [Sorangium aterium]